MFLTVHAIIGAEIGKAIPNPIIAFIAGFVSHFIFDIIPHGDEKWLNKINKKNKLKWFMLIGAFDLTASVALVWFLSGFNFLGQESSVLAGILGSVIPDILNLGYFITRMKFLRGFSIIHELFHDLIRFSPLTYWNEFLIQAGLFCVVAAKLFV